MAEGKGSGVKAGLLGLIGGIIGAAIVAAALIFTGVLSLKTPTTAATTESAETDSATSSVTINASSESTSLATAVAAKVLPSVVSISITTDSGSGVGSGSILDANGNIITNYHVIDGATAISVSLSTGDSYSAEVVGYDQSSDLAVIKIDAGSTTLTPIEWGDSTELQVGDWVMSAGSPFGLDQSVSTGIVSSLYRDTMLSSSSGKKIYTNLIQTDATINPGNSGGPLVNSEGKMVGINSIIESYSGSSSGVGFAIPSSYAKSVAEKLIAGETVYHAYLGGSFQTVNATNAARNNLSVSSGAYVASVVSGSPADEAGIEAGDIITAIGDHEVTSSDGLILAIRSYNIGDTVTVKFVRGTEEKSVQVTLGSDEALQSSNSGSSSDSGDSSSDQNSLLQQYRDYLEQLLNGNGYGDSYGNGGNGYN